MGHVFSITGTIFSIIALGYICVAARVIKKDALHSFGRFVVLIALPALIFKTLTGQDIEDIVNFSYYGSYLFGSLLVLAAGYIGAGVVSPLKPIQRTFDAAGMTCANSGFIGYPILLLAMPAIAPKALSLNMMVENLVVLPLVILLAELTSGRTNRVGVVSKVARRVLANPLVLAMIAGVVFIVFGFELPRPLTQAVDLLAASSVALSLFVIGGTIGGIVGIRIGRRVALIVAGKLVALPLAVWLGMHVMTSLGVGVDDPELRRAAVIMAATPAMTIYPILAQQYGEEEVAATAMLAMVFLSFFTISALLYFLQ